MKMANNTTAVDYKNVYGAFELKRLYPKHYGYGFLGAILFHLLIIGVYFLIEAINAKEEDYSDAPVVSMKYSEMGPPPSIVQEVAPQAAAAAAAVKPNVGVPVPVEDSKAAPEQTLASQSEMSRAIAPTQTISDGGNVQVTQDIKIEKEVKQSDDNLDPSAFVAVEKNPEPISLVKPVYPEIAQRAGLTGLVVLRVLVNKEGKPMRTAVIKADNDIFVEPAKEAAMKTLFTPAIQNGKPITCWVNIPFRFSLNK
jgi:TonB family protein